MSWGDDLAGWWLGEVEADPAYSSQVLPLAMAMLDPQPEKRYLDLGCGDGRLLAAITAVGASAIGVDAAPRLAAIAARVGPVVVGRIPQLGFLADASVDGVVMVLVLEHLDDAAAAFGEARRVTRDGGVMALVMNHPLLTAPGSGPFVDPDDGEVLWRWGSYLSGGHTDEPAGPGTARFHHRSIGCLLSAAAASGWTLDGVQEAGHDPALTDDPLLLAQVEVPRLIGIRWSAFSRP